MKKIKKKKEEDEMNKAATKIGAAYRGKRARREVAKIKAEKSKKKKVPKAKETVEPEKQETPIENEEVDIGII